MQIANLNINLPQKKEEEFLKIDFAPLFTYPFKEQKEFDLRLDLKEQDDSENYKSKLFSIRNSFSKKQKILEIVENSNEVLVLKNLLIEDETLFSNNLLIKVKDGVKATVIEVFANSSKNSCFLANRTVILGENSSLEYVKIQDINESNSLIFSSKIKQKDSSNLEISNFEFGDGFIVNSFENEINNKNINYELNGLNKLREKANCSTLIKTIHNNESSRSNINYKNSLLDSSRAVVKINSIVTEKGLYSKAFQNCNTILLSDDAVIFAQPFLEIFTDELEASHGATTGTLNKDELYYLQTRGISEENAYLMLLEAFENSIKDNLKDEKAKEFIENYKKESYI